MNNLFCLFAVGAVCALGFLAGSPADAAQHGFDLQAFVGAAPAVALGGLTINRQTLTGLYTAFNTAFNAGLGQAPSQYTTVATVTNSTTRTNEYGWLGKLPGMREWVGDRVIHGLQAHGYSIKNKPFEMTVGVDRDDIDDDNLGVYTPLFTAMGQSAGAHPDELVFPFLKAGFTTACYDGQYMFDTDHPVLDANGNVTSVANTDGGAGTPWFLYDSKKPIKPVIFQKRRDYTFQAMDKMDDENVFMRKEYRYGVDARVNVGFGLWQSVWGSKQAFDKDAYKTARAALQEMKGDYGRPLGNMPDTLVVPPSLEGAALEVVNSERDAAGATNVWKGTAKVIVVPWLA